MISHNMIKIIASQAVSKYFFMRKKNKLCGNYYITEKIIYWQNTFFLIIHQTLICYDIDWRDIVKEMESQFQTVYRNPLTDSVENNGYCTQTWRRLSFRSTGKVWAGGMKKIRTHDIKHPLFILNPHI